jgi:hypothetical protein
VECRKSSKIKNNSISTSIQNTTALIFICTNCQKATEVKQISSSWIVSTFSNYNGTLKIERKAFGNNNKNILGHTGPISYLTLAI